MKYLFWNTNLKKNINMYLEQLIVQFDPDIIGLAEYKDNIALLLKHLKDQNMTYYNIRPMGSRVQVISKFPSSRVIHGAEEKHFVIKGFPYNDGENHNVVFLHLPSKREDAGGRRAAALRQVRSAIKGSSKTIIIGDFNMNPYEKIMTSVLEMNY